MKEMNTDLYEALYTLKYECKMIKDCKKCPLSIENVDGDVTCMLEICRPCNLAISERYYVGMGVISNE